MRLIAVTHEGLEKAAEIELGKFGAKTVAPGHVEVNAELKELVRARTIDKIVLPIAEFDFTGVDAIYKKLKETDLEYSPASFAIDAHVYGTDVKSVDVAKAAGKAFVEKYGWKVDLKNPALVIRVDVSEKVVAGVDMTKGSSLSKRAWAPEFDATIAAAMVILSGAKRIADPNCGDGTIVIEAGLLGAEALGVRPKESARKKIMSAGVEDKVKLALSMDVPFGPDMIITAFPDDVSFSLPAVFFSNKKLDCEILAELASGKIYRTRPSEAKQLQLLAPLAHKPTSA